MDGTGSGIASFDVSASENGGVYSLWQDHTTQSSASYTGVNGHTYRFYSVARDNVGNTEAAPALSVGRKGLSSSLRPMPRIPMAVWLS